MSLEGIVPRIQDDDFSRSLRAANRSGAGSEQDRDRDLETSEGQHSIITEDFQRMRPVSRLDSL